MTVTAARLAASLLVFATALLVVGVSAERSEAPNGESAEASAREAEHAEGAEESESIESHDEAGENNVLGLDAESQAAVALASLASLLAAAALWITGRRPAAITVIVLGLAFAVFDIAEVAHQLDERRAGLATLAAAVAATHLGAAAAAARLATTRPT